MSLGQNEAIAVRILGAGGIHSHLMEVEGNQHVDCGQGTADVAGLAGGDRFYYAPPGFLGNVGQIRGSEIVLDA